MRLRLLDTNARVYAQIVPRVVAAAPRAVLMVVTDPPDPLADLTRRLAGHERVFSTGTLIDSLRFRVHLADRLRVRPRDVQAMVVGEHGTSEVLLWSSASVGGLPVLDLLGRDGESVEQLREQIERDIRSANINNTASVAAPPPAWDACNAGQDRGGADARGGDRGIGVGRMRPGRPPQPGP